MSSKKGSSGSHGGDDRGRDRDDRGNKALVTGGKKKVIKDLGLVETKAGPMDYLQKGKTTGMYASKLMGTKGGTGFYGSEADESTNNYLVSIGEAKVGNYFKQVGGETIRLSKAEGEKLYKAGVEGVSRSYMVTSKGKEIKYGKSNSAMGSGDPSGIMTSTAISQPMHKRQQKIKAMTLAALSFVAPSPVSTLLRMGAMESYGKMGQAGYSQYLNKFYSNISGETSSYASKGTVNENTKDKEVASANITKTRTSGESTTGGDTRFKSLAAISTGGSGATDEDNRGFLSKKVK